MPCHISPSETKGNACCTASRQLSTIQSPVERPDLGRRHLDSSSWRKPILWAWSLLSQVALEVRPVQQALDSRHRHLVPH